MSSYGIIRSIDDLGRIVIPAEMRKAMKIDRGTPLEIYVANDVICLKKHLSAEVSLEKLMCEVKENLGVHHNRDGIEEKMNEALRLLKEPL